MAAVLCDLKPGDEVIMPSFTFSSTANAFVLRGATIVFVDIRPDTMNLDEEKIEAAITDQTRVIVPVHYAGVACEMNRILEIAKKHHLLVVEDAAQAVRAYYHGKALGTFGDFGCYSFHETKNYSMGEGGALLVQDPERAEAAEIIREKGTNRSRFLRGQVDKYTWVDLGSSYLPSELNAAYLYAELEEADTINEARLHAWDHYHQGFEALAAKGLVERPTIPEGCAHKRPYVLPQGKRSGRTHRTDRLFEGTRRRRSVPLCTAAFGGTLDRVLAGLTAWTNTPPRKANACCACRCTTA